MGKKLTTVDFISRAKSIHGDKYDYSKSEYILSHIDLTIICPTHGEFSQSPNSHLNGKGCMSCSGRKKLTTVDFIEKAKSIHGDKYDYSKSEYTKAKCYLTIICPTHGEFNQRADLHLKGHGCNFCAKEKRPLTNTSDTKTFIEKAKSIHGDKYDYSKSEYVKSHEKITITCPTHGEFSQTPSAHLFGYGCYNCSTRGYNPSKTGYVYIMRSDCGSYVKIGITNNPDKRVKSLTLSTPFSFSMVECFNVDGTLAPLIESYCHHEKVAISAKFKDFNGAREWFKYNEQLVELVRSMCGH